MAETSHGAVLASRLQPEHAESLWHNHPLLLVVWWGNTLEDLETFHGGSTPGGFVGNHTTDGLVEDARGSAEMERSFSIVSDGPEGLQHVVAHQDLNIPPRVGL